MPVQATTLPIFQQVKDPYFYIFKGCHMLVSAPTGSGKTMAYLLPIISHLSKEINCSPSDSECKKGHHISPSCIILSTTQELIRQVWTEAVKIGQTDFPEKGKIAILRKDHYNKRSKVRILESNFDHPVLI